MFLMLMDENQKKERQKKLDGVLTEAERKISELEKRRDMLVVDVDERARLVAIERLRKDISG